MNAMGCWTGAGANKKSILAHVISFNLSRSLFSLFFPSLSLSVSLSPVRYEVHVLDKGFLFDFLLPKLTDAWRMEQEHTIGAGRKSEAGRVTRSARARDVR